MSLPPQVSHEAVEALLARSSGDYLQPPTVTSINYESRGRYIVQFTVDGEDRSTLYQSIARSGAGGRLPGARTVARWVADLRARHPLLVIHADGRREPNRRHMRVMITCPNGHTSEVDASALLRNSPNSGCDPCSIESWLERAHTPEVRAKAVQNTDWSKRPSLNLTRCRRDPFGEGMAPAVFYTYVNAQVRQVKYGVTFKDHARKRGSYGPEAVLVLHYAGTGLQVTEAEGECYALHPGLGEDAWTRNGRETIPLTDDLLLRISDIADRWDLVPL